MATFDENNVISSMKVHPKYLQSNATSHTWPLAAFAELIDNAFDAKAKEVQIDQLTLQNTRCLSFQDDGRGMDAVHLHEMLSFGYSDAHERHHVGMYGNGFKSGSMRLGKDTIVLTRTADSAGVGLLSQSYLRAVDADSVRVPMLHYKFPGFDPVKQHGREANLRAILEHSPFKQEQELIDKMRAFSGTGTLIVIYNLCRVDKYDRIELDFISDPHDIRCPYISGDDHEDKISYRNSLKQYCSILYLQPRMKIKIRGVPVKTRLIEKYLRHAHVDNYQPKGESKSYRITFGQVPVTDTSGDYGIMFYRDNRLIKPYEKVTCQKQNDGVGLGIVGVTDAGFLTPTHNKQDFVRDEKFLAAMISYSKKLKNYWTLVHDVVPGSSSSEDTDWVQCDSKECLKWRRLPYGYDISTLPQKWYCHLHPNEIDCNFPEDVHLAGEKVKKVRQNRRASDATKRLKSKRNPVDATAELNGKSCKQAKMSSYLQLETSRATYSGQDINSAGPILQLAITPSCSSDAFCSLGETSSNLSICDTVGLEGSLVTARQVGLGSDSSLEVLSSEQADDGASGRSVLGTDESCHRCSGGNHHTGLDTSSRGDHSTGGDCSTGRDHSTGLDTSRGDYSTGGDCSTGRDHSTGLDTSRGDHSTGVDCFIGGDHCNGIDSSAWGDHSPGGGSFVREGCPNGYSHCAMKDCSTDSDSFARGDRPHGYLHSAKKDCSTDSDSFARDANIVNGDNSAESEHSTSSKHHIGQLEKSGSFVARQNGDYSDSVPNSSKKNGKQFTTEHVDHGLDKIRIKLEPANDMSAAIIKTEPVNDMSAAIIKTEPVAANLFLEKQAGGVVAALGPGQTGGVETVDVPGQQTRTMAASMTQIPAGNTIIADLQRKLEAKDRHIHYIQNQLQTFRSSVCQLLRRLAPDVEIGDSDNIEQLVKSMLIADIDD